MKHMFVLSALVVVGAMSSHAYAQAPRDTIFFTASSVLWRPRFPENELNGTPRAMPTHSWRHIDLKTAEVRGKKVLEGALIGFTVGALTGITIGAFEGTDDFLPFAIVFGCIGLPVGAAFAVISESRRP